MGKFTGLLVCSDFDGTIAYRAKVSQANADAVRYFQEHGGLFTLATGRYPSIINEAGTPFRCNAPLVVLNGTLLYDQERQKTLYEEFLPKGYTETLLSVLRESEGLRDVMCFPTSVWKSHMVDPRDEEGLRTALREELYKLVIHVDTEQSDVIKEGMLRRFGSDYAICRSWINGIEIHSAACDKGKTARRLAELVGADRLICVGDYENDLPMLKEADVGYAMGNAVDALKSIADFILPSVEKDGFAEMIYSL